MPTLYPPIDSERVDSPSNEMLSSELKESFETAHAIHRAQELLKEYQDPEDNPREEGSNDADVDKIVSDEISDSTRTSTASIQKKRRFEYNTRVGNVKSTLDDKSVFEELEARKFEAALAAAVTAESEILNLSNGIAELEAMLQSTNENMHATDEEKKQQEGEKAEGVVDDSIIKESRFPSLPSMITCFKNGATCSDIVSMPVKVDADDG